MSEDAEDRGFKVEDKRRFDADGRARSDDEAGDAEAGDAEAEETAGPASPEPSGPAEGGAPMADLSFSSFVVGLATQAFMFLGAGPDPKTGLVAKDLGQAKALIDIIAMLGEKTAGNLSEDEGRMLEEMLYELRMQYVSETQAPVTDGAEK